MGFLFGQPKIQGDERNDCLAYIEKELKISFLHQKERDNYKNKVAECSARTNTTAEFLETVQPTIIQLLESTKDLINQRNDFLPVPKVAEPAYYAWGKVYTTHLIWATEVSESSQITSRERDLQRDYEFALVEAAGEHGKLMKKLKLGEGEAQELLNRAITSVSRGEP